MALNPQGRYVTFTLGASSSVLYLAGADFEKITEPLKRLEMTHAKQREAKETDGTKPIFVDLIFGVPCQILSTSSVTTTPRALTPEDSALDTIYQKLFITRFTFQGTMSNSSDIGTIYSIAQTHKIYQDRFDAYKSFASEDVSFAELLALQGQTFPYLTTTGLTCAGTTFGTLNNMFIRSFRAEPVRDINAGAKVLYTWNMVLDSIQITALNA